MTTELKSANYYKLDEGSIIPPRLSMQERITYSKGLMPSNEFQAYVMAVQDTASSRLNVMAKLVEMSGNEELIKKANIVLDKWNNECDQLFKVTSENKKSPKF